ncbi:uncharacterized protein LOC113359711 [Papaver somniferum]|uniref:uncharacterized protein LOC113359711 n=1 Tax=Papaver somniferum TaxID=3469 RepID=UPI000E705113|nr:uncharacterized protein LOC113359711 [Papaver somniferum]
MENSVDLEVISADKNVIHFRIHSLTGSDWDLLCVYGPPQNHLRNKFWKGLSQYAAQLANPWCLVGDLNAITSTNEKHGGSQKLSNANIEFRNFIQDRGLIDLGYTGPAFTWSNGAIVEKPIFERLDRAVCTADWFFMFPDNGVLHLPRISSDHAPILHDTIRKIMDVGKRLNEWSRKTFGNIFRAAEKCKEKLLKVQ